MTAAERAPAATTGRPGRVLVTGANGHLGRRLLSRLCGERPLRAVVRSRPAAEALARLPEAGRFETRVLDPSDADSLALAAEGCRHAVHLVGILKESRSSRYVDAHERAAEALARAADRHGLARIVSLGILGSRPDSSNACLASKARAEQILLAARTPTLVLRVPMVLGEGDHAARALRREARARLVPLMRGGRSLEQPIYAGDVIEAIVSGLSLDGEGDLELDLAGPESLPRRELLARCARLWGTHPRVLPVPFALNLAAAALLERVLPDPPITRAMLGVLDHDDRIDAGPACARLGLQLTPLDEMLRRCTGPEARP